MSSERLLVPYVTMIESSPGAPIPFVAQDSSSCSWPACYGVNSAQGEKVWTGVDCYLCSAPRGPLCLWFFGTYGVRDQTLTGRNKSLLCTF